VRGRQPLTVRVDDELVLDTGRWEEVTDEAGGVKRLVHPPQTTLFEQVLDHLASIAEPVGRRRPGPAEEAIAATAVCLRWGSYLAVLADRDKPPWPGGRQERTSRISDSEMARINVEASAALERWIELLRNDYHRYVALALASRRLPMTRRHAPRSDDGEQLLLLLHPRLSEAVASRLDSEWGRRAQASAEAQPTRVLANSLVLVTWRNGPVEDIHAGWSTPLPLTRRRLLPSEERRLVATTSGRLVHGLGVVHALALERSDRSWPQRVLPCAVAPFLAPRGWSLHEQTRPAELPGPEP